MSFVRPTLTELIERARGDMDAWLPGADSRLRHSVLDVLVRTHAGAANGLHGYLDYLARQILPDTAEGDFLARRASERGIVRKVAGVASGRVTLTGSDGAIADAGAVLVRADGARFVATAAVAIAGGTALLPVEAEAIGPDGNCPALQPLTFASPAVGIQATGLVAVPGIIGGLDEESDESLLARLLFELRNPPHGGNAADYKAWALEVPGVTRAWSYPAYLGPGSVGVAFVVDGRPDIIPTGPEVAAVQAYIDALRPVTAAVTVFAPIARPLNLSLRALPDTADIRAAIAAEVTDMTFREAEPGGTILLTHINEAISIAAGEQDHQLIVPPADVHAAPGEIFVMGTIAFA